MKKYFCPECGTELNGNEEQFNATVAYYARIKLNNKNEIVAERLFADASESIKTGELYYHNCGATFDKFKKGGE